MSGQQEDHTFYNTPSIIGGAVVATSKIYLLKPSAKYAEGNYPNEDVEDNPWDPWYDACFGMVVSANSEEEARAIAVEYAGAEGQNVWLSKEFTTCEEVKNTGFVLASIRYA